MSTLAKFLITLSIVCFAQVTVADTAKRNFSVTVSDEVKQQLQKLSSNERKKVKAAIKSGNQFVPHYFDGSANNITDEQSVKVWRKNIRPLVNKDYIKWADMRSERSPVLELGITERELTPYATVCPQVELMSFQVEPGSVNLRYRTRVIGVLKFKRGAPGELEKLVSNNEKDFQEAEVGVVQNNKVDYVAEKFLGLFVIPDFFIEGYYRRIKLQGHRLKSKQLDERKQAKEEIQQYQEWIRLIKEQEAAVCKAN